MTTAYTTAAPVTGDQPRTCCMTTPAPLNWTRMYGRNASSEARPMTAVRRRLSKRGPMNSAWVNSRSRAPIRRTFAPKKKSGTSAVAP
jgi:hypothetical protein